MDCSKNKVFNTIGICGSGKMGVSFFNFIVQFDFDIVFYIRNKEKLQKIQKLYEKRKFYKIVTFANELTCLSDCDIVFEFVSEDLEVKKKIIEALLMQRRNINQIIASGSSTHVPSRICSEQYIRSCIGVHFIYPVQYVKTAEVVCGIQTSSETVDKIKKLLLSLGKKPVIVSEEVGTFTIKIMTAAQNEAFNIVEELHILPRHIDTIVASHNLMLPPFELCDSIGLEIILNGIEGQYYGKEADGSYLGFEKCLEKMVASGCLGKKNGKGFFNDMEHTYCKKPCDPEEIDESLIYDRIKLAYINSCLRIIDNAWLEITEIDSAMCEVYQSPTGPIAFLFKTGPKEILNMLEELSGRYGNNFEPPKVLRYIVNNNIRSDEIDRQIRLFKVGGTRPDWHN